MDSLRCSCSVSKVDNLSSISLLDRLKVEIFSINTGRRESVSSICDNDLSTSLTDTEPDCIPFFV